jgi:hypothetical protein
MSKFTRKVSTPNTTFMRRKHARATQQRATGRLHAREGHHSGGPCPAVALATLAARSYGWAYRYLKAETGYAGAGEFRGPLDRAAERIFGPGRRIPGHGSCARFVSSLGSDANGFAYVAGHVMPIRNGRLLNASARHQRMHCEGVTLFDINEVRES